MYHINLKNWAKFQNQWRIILISRLFLIFYPKVPLFIAFTMPWSRTTAFPHPFAVPPVPLGASFNYSTYIAVENSLWIPIRSKFHRFREMLQLPPISNENWSWIFNIY